MKEYESYVLDNGLRIIHKDNPSNVSYCGFFINVGTRDEDFSEYGMAHFVEHMLFKGTQKRKSFHIINRMEAVGGELNAYTNKEETVIYSAFLEQDFDRAFELLYDLIFNSQFPQQEIEKEIDVIMDEINLYEDSPSELIFDEFDNFVFQNSQLGHNILGEASLLKTFDTDKTRNFVQKHYVPSNIVFFSFGKTKFSKITKIAQKYLSGIGAAERVNNRIIPPETKIFMDRMNKNTSQGHVLMGSRSYDLFSSKRKAFSLLNNILGGPGMNSRLNISLREKRGYVYNVESNINTYSDIGLFSIYFGTDKQNVDKCLKLVHLELKKLRENKLTQLQLTAAKKQMLGQIGVNSDNNENKALSLGKSFFYYNHYDTLEEIAKKIEAVTAENILEVANEIFDENRLSILIFS